MARLFKHWNHYRILQTTAGTFRSAYHPGAPNEYVTVIGPGEQTTQVPTPALGDWQLAAEDGFIVVYYKRLDGDWSEEVRVATNIACGQAAGALVTGGVGPMGPGGAPGIKGDKGDPGEPGEPGGDAEVTDEVIGRIAAAVVARLFSEPPAPDHFGLPEYAQYGSRLQETIAIIPHQGYLQWLAHNFGEALVNMQREGRLPPMPQ